MPEFRLRHFSDESDQVRVRSRQHGSWTSSVRKAAAITRVYSLPSDDGTTDNSAEFTLGGAESALVGRSPATLRVSPEHNCLSYQV
jgi:hypothetical protein